MILGPYRRAQELFVLLVLLTCCCADAPKTSSHGAEAIAEQQKTFQVVVPDATWEPIFFREINERAGIAKLPNLRAAAVPNGDVETRVWVGFGLTALTGFDFKRTAGQWTGIYVRGIRPGLAKKDYQLNLKPPKSGWDAFWRRLTDAGFLSLPDAKAIDCSSGALDGVAYVVEMNLDQKYRTYMYDNPQVAECPEAKRMIAIMDVLYDEFGSSLPRG